MLPVRPAHRGLLPTLVAVLALGACGAAMPHKYAYAQATAGVAPPMTPVAADTAPTATQIPEQLVIEGSLSVEVTEVGDLIDALRGAVEAGGGRIINEEVYGGETSWRAHVKLRLPPAQVEPTVAFLAKRGQILDKRITAQDVSRELFDQQLALDNLRATSARLQKLLDQGGLAMADILAIEKELTRIRGEIEGIEGSQRFLQDRVALATLDIELSRRDGAVTVAKAKFYPGVRFTSLTLLDPEGRTGTRAGVGVMLHTVLRSVSTEIDVYQAEPAAAGADAKASVIATFGGAAYSDFLGRGRRRVLNPYLGLRLGYAYLDTSRFVVQGEVGLELYKHEHFLIEAIARATGLIGNKTDAAIVGGAGAVVAF